MKVMEEATALNRGWYEWGRWRPFTSVDAKYLMKGGDYERKKWRVATSFSEMSTEAMSLMSN